MTVLSRAPEPQRHVRPMKGEDLEHIHRIECASYDHPWTRGNFADSLAAGYSMWVHECGGEPIGYYVMMAGAGDAHLLNLTVSPAWRRQGLGRDLLGHCMASACDHHAERVFLEVRASNAAAIALYHANGFVDLALRRGYYPAHEGREDALIMKRELSC